MAAIDRIYGNLKQYDELYAWCKEHKEQACCYFYDRDRFESITNTTCNTTSVCDTSGIKAIANFPMFIDEWMLANCKIPWVMRRIKEQYFRSIDPETGLLEVTEYSEDKLDVYKNTCEFCGKEFEFTYSDYKNSDNIRTIHEDDDGYEYEVIRIECPFCEEYTRIKYNWSDK